MYLCLAGNEISVLDQSANLVHPNEVLKRLRTFVETEIVQQVPATTFRSKAKRGHVAILKGLPSVNVMLVGITDLQGSVDVQ